MLLYLIIPMVFLLNWMSGIILIQLISSLACFRCLEP